MARLQRLSTNLAQLGQTRSMFYACISAGTMTRAVKIGERAAAWPSDEVDAIVRARIAGATDNDLRRLVDKLHAARKALAPTFATEEAA